MASMTRSTSAAQRYAKAEYWDARFREQVHDGASGKRMSFFDWYMGYTEIADFLPSPAEGIHDVLIIGCGNSQLPEDLVTRHGFRHVCCIDLSRTIIEAMSMHYAEHADLNDRLEWLCVDATMMGAFFEGRRFDLIIDKGTLDALMCSGSTDSAVALLKEIPKVLQPDTGRVLLISHSPHRDSLLSGVDLRVCQVRRGELSTQAMLINIMRSRAVPVASADSTSMVEMMKEVRQEEARKRLRQFLKVLRNTGGRTGNNSVTKPEFVDERIQYNSESVVGKPTPHPARQNHCWVYILSALDRGGAL